MATSPSLARYLKYTGRQPRGGKQQFAHLAMHQIELYQATEIFSAVLLIDAPTEEKLLTEIQEENCGPYSPVAISDFSIGHRGSWIACSRF